MSDAQVQPVDLDGLFDAWERAFSGRDPGAFAPLCAPGFQYEDPLTREPLTWQHPFLRHVRGLWRAFPDARLHRTGDRLANGRCAVAPVKLLGTQERPLGRLAATRRPVIVHGVFYAELAEGRLFRVRAFFDVYGAGVQLGALPKTGSAGERALLALRGFGLRTP